MALGEKAKCFLPNNHLVTAFVVILFIRMRNPRIETQDEQQLSMELLKMKPLVEEN
jgi:hypothetical protein